MHNKMIFHILVFDVVSDDKTLKKIRRENTLMILLALNKRLGILSGEGYGNSSMPLKTSDADKSLWGQRLSATFAQC